MVNFEKYNKWGNFLVYSIFAMLEI